MQRCQQKSSAFTLVEVMVASTISVLVLAAIMPISMDLLNQSQVSAIRADLRGRVNVGRGYLFHDIRGTSRSGMITGTNSNNNIVAISMPVYVRASDSEVPVTITGTNCSVNWTKQVIYYVSTTTGVGASTNLYRADLPYDTFKALSNANQTTLLNNLVASHATGVVTLSSNRPIVRGLKTSSIVLGNNVDVDGYSTSVQQATVSIGTALLDAGAHSLKFTVTGKNTAATSYGIGIDSFAVSPANVQLEGESYIAGATNVAGGATLATRMMNPSWHNNQILNFPATATGNSFTLNYYYDTWEESVFTEGSAVAFTNTKAAALVDGDAVVQMAGNDTSWHVETQITGNGTLATDTNSLKGCTVRTIINGAKILYDGRQAKVTFVASRSPASSSPFLSITDAYIMERSGTTGYNGTGTSSAQLSFSSAPWSYPGGWIFDKSTGNNVSSGTSILVWGTFASGYTTGAFKIDRTKDYIVSYHVDTPASWGSSWGLEGCQAASAPTDTPMSAIWYNDASNHVNTTTWGGGTYTEVNKMIGVAQVDVTYPDSASYVSQIIDTSMDAPAYRDITWTGDLPSGTGIGVCVRASNLADMSDTPAWSAPYSTPNSTTTLAGVASQRYVQFKADFTTSSPYTATASLRNVKITWPGAKKIVQLTADIAKGPDRGKFNVAVDGNTTPNPLLWTIDMTVAKTYRGREYSDSFSISVKPRNP